MNSLKYVGLISSFMLAVSVAGCRHDAKAAWADVAKDCAFSDLNGEKILFFGPSNSIGPGSIWRQASEAGGGYRVRWESASVPSGAEWMRNGSEFQCQGNNITKFTGAATTTFASDIAPLSAELKAELEKAKSVEVKVAMMKWDTLVEGPFEQAVLALPADAPLKKDLAKPGRLVMYRALLIRGFEAKLSFDTVVGGDVSAKIKDGVLQSINGELGAGLNARWDSNKNLYLSSPSDFYVAGELVEFDMDGGFASGGNSPFSEPVDIKADADIGLEVRSQQ
ncbi:hypothetical protein [Pseudomonas sp. BMS12]|uniref:hypothetical protein n=1 Tax=Pseudomonas sp. BMS12 TaxID=1796033 RepID=UPI000A3EDEE6|nr:hypothetical protein [Pseudomonas sp. BMS12]